MFDVLRFRKQSQRPAPPQLLASNSKPQGLVYIQVFPQRISASRRMKFASERLEVVSLLSCRAPNGLVLRQALCARRNRLPLGRCPLQACLRAFGVASLGRHAKPLISTVPCVG